MSWIPRSTAAICGIEIGTIIILIHVADVPLRTKAVSNDEYRI